jgi:hypothetical protein
MSEKIAAQEDSGFGFTDEDFERRYSPEEDVHSGAGPDNLSRPAAPIGRSRNRFMRTLLRRRFISSASS